MKKDDDFLILTDTSIKANPVIVDNVFNGKFKGILSDVYFHHEITPNDCNAALLNAAFEGAQIITTQNGLYICAGWYINEYKDDKNFIERFVNCVNRIMDFVSAEHKLC
jgi:hypothetical protein